MSSAKQKRGYYRKNPEKFRELSRRYYWKNREKVLAKKSAWHAANKAASLARCQSYRAANPSYTSEYGQRRRVRDAWLKFTTTCAENRRASEAL